MVRSIHNQDEQLNKKEINAREADLISRLCREDEDAADQLFYTYFERLYSMVFYSVGKERDIAEDITQETLISALKAVRKFKGKSSLYTWLLSIANHKIADYYRRLNNERRRNKHVLNSLPIESPDFDNVVEEALESLPFLYRQVLLLKYIEDLSVAEISQVMNRTEKSIEALLFRGRKLLREKISKNSE